MVLPGKPPVKVSKRFNNRRILNMPPTCSICKHKDRKAIDSALAKGQPSRPIASKFRVGYKAIQRHLNTCIPKAMAKVRGVRRAIQQEREAIEEQVIREAIAEQKLAPVVLPVVEDVVGRIFDCLLKLYDACDLDLRDPDDDTIYNLGPRTKEQMDKIIWDEPDKDNPGQWVKKSGTLEEALALAFPDDTRRLVRVLPIHHKDRAELLLDLTDKLCKNANFLAELEGRFKKAEKEINQGATIQLSVIDQILRQYGMLPEQGH
jgi:hypothetical protein